MNENITYEIEPCPFCGAEASFTDPDWEHGFTAYVAVQCTKCFARSAPVSFSITSQCGGIGSEWRQPYERKALELWNTRATHNAELRGRPLADGPA